jgi:hypothetical protein
VPGCNCCSKTLLKFETTLGSGNCGQLKDTTGNKQIDLACGGLYFGGGNDAVPLPATVPDMGLSFTKIGTCNAATGALGLAAASTTDVGGTHPNRHCTNASATNPEYPSRNGCLFGAPLPIPNTSSPTISTCVVNRVTTDATGSGNCNDGTTSLTLPLGSDIYLTGDLLDGSAPNRPNEPGIQPCPICKANLCEGGPNHGLACTPESSALGGAGPTSHDCPPPGNTVACNGSSACIGTLPIPFALTTGTATKTAIDITPNTGIFCGFCATPAGVFHNPGMPCTANAVCTTAPFTVCRQKDPGAFGTNLVSPFTTTHEISETGTAPNVCIGDGVAHNSTLVSVFCIPPTFNATVDNAADLPGPGAVSLPGSASVQ